MMNKFLVAWQWATCNFSDHLRLLFLSVTCNFTGPEYSTCIHRKDNRGFSKTDSSCGMPAFALTAMTSPSLNNYLLLGSYCNNFFSGETSIVTRFLVSNLIDSESSFRMFSLVFSNWNPISFLFVCLQSSVLELSSFSRLNNYEFCQFSIDVYSIMFLKSYISFLCIFSIPLYCTSDEAKIYNISYEGTLLYSTKKPQLFQIICLDFYYYYSILVALHLVVTEK